jgi:hypothetical protein
VSQEPLGTLQFTCSEADCPVQAGELPCKLGNSVEQCPNAAPKKEPLVPEPPATSSPTAEEVVAQQPTHPGVALTWTEAAAITRERRTTVVVLASEQGWGKTTLLSGAYELFHHGEVGGLRFAGSQTLLGFEERRHLTRAASELATPRTERTHRGMDGALHLDVEVIEDGGRRTDLLFLAPILASVRNRHPG